MKLGLERVPCVVVDDLTPQQIKALRLADNKTNELAGWNFGELDLELEGLLDMDMSRFGFDIDEDEEIPDNLERDVDGKKDKIQVTITFKDNNTYDKYIDAIKEMLKGQADIKVNEV